MSRYFEAPEELTGILNEEIEEYFPELVSCHIMLLMDSKKRKSKGKYIFASIKKMSECERFLSADKFVTDGYDYLLVVDNEVYSNITTEDRKKLLFHELCHIFVDNDSKSPYKTVDHDITGFKREFDTFPDILDTWDRLSQIAESIYSKE